MREVRSIWEGIQKVSGLAKEGWLWGRESVRVMCEVG